eukprot:1756837-Prymnesium_polylepis.1
MKRAGSLCAVLGGSRSYASLEESTAWSHSLSQPATVLRCSPSVGGPPRGAGFDMCSNVELMQRMAERSQHTEQDVRKRTLQTCRLSTVRQHAVGRGGPRWAAVWAVRQSLRSPPMSSNLHGHVRHRHRSDRVRAARPSPRARA